MMRVHGKYHAQIFEFFIGCIIYSFKPLLILFLVQELSLPLTMAYAIMACFLGISSIIQTLATNFIDKVITPAFAIYQGLILNLIGIFLMLFASVKAMYWLYFDLSLIVMGEVLFASGVLIFSSKLCKKDSAGMIFSNNYLFLNIGSIIGPIISGLLYSLLGMNAALHSILIFLILAMVNFFIFFLRKSSILRFKNQNWLKPILVQLIIFAVSFAVGLFYFVNISFELFELVLWTLMSVFVFWQLNKPDFRNNKTRIDVFIINLMAVFFFMVFGQINGPIVLFINSHVLNQIDNFRIPPQWLSSLEPALLILLLSWLKFFPDIANFFEKFSILQKLTIAMLFLAGAFALLTMVSYSHLNTDVKINICWFIPFYLFVSISEIMFFPSCLSYLSRISPVKLSGLIFSYFFTSRGIGIYFSMDFSRLVFNIDHTRNPGLLTYIFLFAIVAIIAILISLVAIVCEKIQGKSIDQLNLQPTTT
jgi:dipeptide/tripeptide permease